MTAEASIVFALKKIETCQANKACLSALSKLPESQRSTLEEAMVIVHKYLVIACGSVEQVQGAAAGSEIDEHWVATARRLAFLVDEVMDKYFYHALKLRQLRRHKEKEKEKEKEEEEEEEEKEKEKEKELARFHQEGLSQVVRWTAEIQGQVKSIARLRELCVPASNLDVTSQGSENIIEKIGRWWRNGCDLVMMPPEDDGRHKNKNVDLKNFLTNEYLTDFFSLERSRKVLSIVGSAMSTTGQANAIASELYNDTKRHFKCCVSVTLSKGDPTDTKKVLSDILGQLNGNSGENNGRDPIEQIQQALNLKRYIVLIHDLGEASTWDCIQRAFPDNGMCSRVIVTTRRLDVAEKCFLGVSDLIFKVSHPAAAADGGRRHANDDDDDDKILVEEEKAANLVVDKLLSGSLSDLRDCSLYLSTVRDEEEFDMDSMVRKWVAEGFIFVYEVGYKHFSDLLGMNVIQVERQCCKFGEGPTYKMNPKMAFRLREISRKEGFATHIDTIGSSEEDGHMVRRFFLHCLDTSSSPPASSSRAEQRWRHARSMTIRGHGKTFVMELEGLHLHVLDLDGCSDLNDNQVVSICKKLILLRYLSIRRTPVTVLPPDVRYLQNLETLDMRQTKITELPKEIHLLARLAHVLENEGLEEIGSEPYPRLPSSLKDHKQLRSTLAVLDITLCQLDKADIKTLGKMSALRRLALALAGVQGQEMVITKGLFPKLEVLELDCRAPWVTFQEESMPELRRLYLRLYAGPIQETPSGTNHLKKLHQVTLSYSEEYENCACVKETARVMVEEGRMRAKPTTFVIGGQVTVPKIHVPDNSKKSLVWAVRKFMRFFFDYIFILVFPFAPFFRPLLARMPKRQLAVAIPLLALLCFWNITLFWRMKPLVLTVSTWLATKVVPILLLYVLYVQARDTKLEYIFVPIIAYKTVFLVYPLLRLLPTAIVLVFQMLSWMVWGLLRLFSLCVLRPTRYVVFTFFSLLAPVGCTIILYRYISDLPGGGHLIIFLPLLLLLFYIFRTLFYLAMPWTPLFLRIIMNWLFWGI